MADLWFAGGWFGKLDRLGRSRPGRKSKRAIDRATLSRRLSLEPLEDRTLLSLTLTSNGQATSTIVVSKEPTVAAAYAAAELQSDLKQVTGATVPIATDDQAVSGTTILVGESAATEALGYQNSSFQSQQYTVDFQPSTLVLMGNDKTQQADSGTATVYGAPLCVNGEFGNALAFSGADALSVANSGFNDNTGSLECWVNFTGTGGNEHGTILRLDGTDPWWGYHILERVDGNCVRYTTYTDNNQTGYSVESGTLSPGWHHVLATHTTASGGKIELFIDGVSQGTAGYNATTCANAQLCVGGYVYGSGLTSNRLIGSIDEIRVSSSVRNYGGSPPTQAPTVDSTTTCLLHLDADSGTVTTYGNPTSATGRYGGAMAFAGADALVVANPGFNDAAGSLECWVNFTGTGGNEDGTILRLDGANPWSYHILERVDGNHVAYVTYDGQHSACVESSAPLTGWHQILATHSTTSGKIELFIDGVSQGTDTYTATTCAGAQLCVGAYVYQGAATNGLLGAVDEVRVSSSVRAQPDDYISQPPAADAATTCLLHFDGDVRIVTAHGDPSNVAGQFGGAQEFAGADAVTVPSSGFDDNTGSLECWVDFTGTGGNDGGTILRLDGADPSTYHVLERINGNGVRYLVYDGKNTYYVDSISNTLTGWHHVLATHTTASGGKIELFIDGVSQGTAGYSATTCALSKLPGDANRDGTVNGADLNVVLSNYNQTIAAGVDGWSWGDFNGDGIVNGADLNIVLSNYNQSVPRVAVQLCVGGYVNGGAVSNGLLGRIDEVRVSSSIRNYGGAAPTQAPTADGSTTCLLHLDALGGAPLEEFVPSQLSLQTVPLPGMYDAQATCYAVYDFLEQYCGVRWFNPTASGSVYPSAPTLTVSGTDSLRTLSYGSRTFSSTFDGLSMTSDQYNAGVETLWTYGSDEYNAYIAAAYPGESQAQITRDVQLFEARMCVGGDPDFCCHSLYGYYARFHVTHPEWFIDPNDPNSQLDYTNPAVIAQVAQDAADYYDGAKSGSELGVSWNPPNPFAIVPMDNNEFAPADMSGTATSYGSPAQITGYFGNATKFAGSDAITAANSGFDDAAGSLECWVNFSGTSNANGTILRLDGATGWWSYHILDRTSDGRVCYQFYNDNTKIGNSVTSGVLSAGWHHILATHSTTTGTIELFIDGVSQGTAAYYATTCANATLCIGGYVSGSTVSNGLLGGIDEVRVSSSIRDYGGQAPTLPPTVDGTTTCLLHFNASTVTMYGDAQWVVGHSGSAVQFAGADALTSVNPGFNDNTGSLECWVYFSGTSGNDSGTILRLDGTSPYWSYHIIDRINGNEVRYRFYNDNTKIGYSVTSGQLSAGWHYILATHSTTTGTIELFIDGVSQGTAAYYATTCAGAQLCMGGYVYQGAVSNGLLGIVDEVRVSSSVRNYGGQPPTQAPTVDSTTTCLLHFNGEGLSQKDASGYFTNGASSDYIFNFVNQVVAVLHAMPGHENDAVSTLAYADWGAVPTHVKLDPSVEVQYCFACNRLPYSTQAYDHEVAYLNAWQNEAAASGRKLGLWLYPNFPLWVAISDHTSNPFYCFPGYYADTIAEQFSLFGNDFSTIFYCGWGQEVEAYVSLKLMADSSLKVNDLLDDYFAEMYGPAATAMEGIYNLIEDTYSNPANYPPGTATNPMHTHQTESIAWGWLGTADVMSQLQSLINQAVSAAGTNNTYATNVNLFEIGTWNYMVAGRNDYLTTANPPTVSIASPAPGAALTGDVAIVASASDNGSIAAVYFYEDGNLLGTDTTAPYSWTWQDPPPGTHNLKVVAVDNQQNATTSSAVSVTVNSPVWARADVGAVGKAGSDSYNPANSQYTINGAGAGVTGTADALHFLYVSLSGDFTITAKVDSFNGTATNAGAGVMLRQSTAAGAIEASLLFKSYSNQVKFNRRTASGGSTSATTSSTSGTSCWVRLVRSGTTVQAFKSNDGVTWTQVGSNVTVSMTNPVLVGLAVTSGTTSSTKQAVFDNVTIIQTGMTDAASATAAGAIEASLLFEPKSKQVALSRRTADGATATATSSASGTSCWVRLIRAGTALKAYKSSDGVTWTQVGADVTVSLLDPIWWDWR